MDNRNNNNYFIAMFPYFFLFFRFCLSGYKAHRKVFASDNPNEK